MAKYLYSYLFKSEQMKLKNIFFFLKKSKFLIQKKKNQTVFQSNKIQQIIVTLTFIQIIVQLRKQ